MKTKLIMIASAIFLGILGTVFQFLPQEILIDFGVDTNPVSVLVIQLAGALFIGFAFLNWMAKENIIGGIYSRPISLANFTHFFIGTISLFRIFVSEIGNILLIIIAIIYAAFTVAFGIIIFTHPIKS